MSGCRRAVVLGGVIVLALAAGMARAEEQGPASGPRPATRPFNSKLYLEVWAQTAVEVKQVGQTPAAKPLEIPTCVVWWVEPIGDTRVDVVAREVQAQAIPGLKLRFAGDVDLVFLKNLKGLRSLDLMDTEITDAGLVHLKDLRGLQTLNLGGTKVTDAGLVHLKGLTGLQSLTLYDTKVTDQGLAHLKGMKDLRLLNLEVTKVTDEGLVHLKDLKALQSLRLDATQVTDQGMLMLRKALPSCHIDP